MSWIKAFINCWFCLLYFVIFVQLFCVAYLILDDNRRNAILLRLNHKSLFVKRLIASVLLIVGLYFLYICYKSVVFSHYVSIEKMTPWVK